MVNVSLKKTKQISQKRLSKPWLTNHLLHQNRLKSKFFSMYPNCRLSNTTNISFHIRVTRLVVEAKQNHYKKILSFCRTNI